MKILAIESSAVAASAAVCEGGKLLCQSFQNRGLTHSRTLMPMIENMLQNSELSLEDIGAIAAAAGPGSFTGLRIGVATAKGLAWGRDIPCIGVSSLEAMAWHTAFTGMVTVSVMDARRSQVYNAVFDSDGIRPLRLTDDRAISVEELENELKKIEKNKILVGDGAELCYNTMKDKIPGLIMAPAELRYQSAWGVAAAAEEKAQRGEFVSAEELIPVYLRLSQAERERLERLKKEC